MTKAVEGLVQALKAIARNDEDFDRDCRHLVVARAALEAFAQRSPLHEDNDLACALIAVLDGQLPPGTDIPLISPLLVVVDAWVLGPRGAGKGEG